MPVVSPYLRLTAKTRGSPSARTLTSAATVVGAKYAVVVDLVLVRRTTAVAEPSGFMATSDQRSALGDAQQAVAHHEHDGDVERCPAFGERIGLDAAAAWTRTPSGYRHAQQRVRADAGRLLRLVAATAALRSECADGHAHGRRHALGDAGVGACLLERGGQQADARQRRAAVRESLCTAFFEHTAFGSAAQANIDTNAALAANGLFSLTH